MSGTTVTAVWRLRGSVLAVRLLPVAGCLLVAVWGVRILLVRGDDALAYTLLSVEALLLAVVLLAVTLRTRVRLLPAGVEVRELRTRTYAWTDIDWVAPTHRHRGVQLGFRDGSARTLPVPRRVSTNVSDRQVARAVHLLQQARGRG